MKQIIFLFWLTLSVNCFSQDGKILRTDHKYQFTIIDEPTCECGLQDVISNNDSLYQSNQINCNGNDLFIDNAGTLFIQGLSIENYSQQSTRSGQTFINSELVRARVFDSSNQSSAQCDAMNDNGVMRAYVGAQDNSGNFTRFEAQTDSAFVVTPNVAQSIANGFLKLISNTGAVEFEALPMGAAVADAVDLTDVVTQFNALLASLRAAGYIAP